MLSLAFAAPVVSGAGAVLLGTAEGMVEGL